MMEAKGSGIYQPCFRVVQEHSGFGEQTDGFQQPLVTRRFMADITATAMKERTRGYHEKISCADINRFYGIHRGADQSLINKRAPDFFA
jgi:hypothetical protein